MWQCRKSVPPKSFTFTLRDRGGVSQLTGRKEDIRKRVVPERFFCVNSKVCSSESEGITVRCGKTDAWRTGASGE